MNIIATIGFSNNNLMDIISLLLSNDITYFRFNLSKYSTNKDQRELIEEIIRAKERYKSRINVMLDLAYPIKKCRINLNYPIKLAKGSTCYISSNEDCDASLKNTIIKIDADGFGKHLKRGDQILYGDGRHAFLVDEIINSNFVKVSLVNDTVVYPGKALHIKDFFPYSNLDEDIVKKINILSPDSIALSFVSSVETINIAKSFFPETKIISKIETQEGLSNIDTISQVSDIMIARGDLLLNIDYKNFYNSQQIIANYAHKNNKELYVATGILSSLTTSLVPSQAEIIDLNELKKLNPHALILNYGLIKGNLFEAKKIINDFFNQ